MDFKPITAATFCEVKSYKKNRDNSGEKRFVTERSLNPEIQLEIIYLTNDLNL